MSPQQSSGGRSISCLEGIDDRVVLSGTLDEPGLAMLLEVHVDPGFEAERFPSLDQELVV